MSLVTYAVLAGPFRLSGSKAPTLSPSNISGDNSFARSRSPYPFPPPLKTPTPFLSHQSITMGLFSSFINKFCEHCSTQSIWTLTFVGTLSFISFFVVINVLRQLLFKNPHEPPVVFHWFPFIGSTISYGIDPYKFFFNCRAKVCSSSSGLQFPIIVAMC